MLLVDARAGISKIHGIGLFAYEFIPKGTHVWMFNPKSRIFRNGIIVTALGVILALFLILF